MEKQYQKFRADSLNEAYDQMRNALGANAVVLRTSQVKEGGLLGLFGRKKVELTVSTTKGARKRSAVERRYAAAAQSMPRQEQQRDEGQSYPNELLAQAAGQPLPGSDERFASTVAHFQQRLNHHPPRAPRWNEQDAESQALRQMRSEQAPRWRTPHPSADFADQLEARETPQVPSVLRPLYRELLGRGVSDKVAAALIERVARQMEAEGLFKEGPVREALRAQLTRLVSATGGIALSPGKRHVAALVGTTGVGKTTNLAKLAAYYALRQRARVALLTVDTYRIGASQQLQVYADILGIPMAVAQDAKEAANAARAFRDFDLLLVDTPGGSQFNVRHLHELRTYLGAVQADEVMLVLSVNTHMEDLRLTVDNYRCVKPTSVLFTKLDETRTFGSIFNILAETAWPMSYLSVGQDVPDDIRLAQPHAVADLIVEGKSRSARSS